MRRLAINLIKFFIFFIGLSSLLLLAYYYSDLYKKIVASKDVYIALKKSKEKSNARVLLFGDSVAEQLFESERDNDNTITSLACSYAISPIGVYIMLENYFEQNPSIKSCVYLMTPFSFNNSLDLPWTYNYFLKPFCKPEYEKYLSSTAKIQIETIPYSNYSQLPIILVTNWSPKFKPVSEESNIFLSDISIQYLKKINEKLQNRNIQFHIIALPISEFNQMRLKTMEKNIPTELALNFENYFNEIKILTDNCFVDHVHFKKPEDYRNEFKLKITRPITLIRK